MFRKCNHTLIIHPHVITSPNSEYVCVNCTQCNLITYIKRSNLMAGQKQRKPKTSKGERRSSKRTGDLLGKGFERKFHNACVKGNLTRGSRKKKPVS